MLFTSYIDSLIGQRVAVIGAGVSNMPLIEDLLSAQIDLTVCDMKSREELGETALSFEKRGAKLQLGAKYLDDLNVDLIFRTPGLMPWHPKLKKAITNGAMLTSEMEVFLDICPCKTIGITGTDGKTTTTSIIGEMLRNAGKTVYIGGNIGTPLLTMTDSIKQDDIVVLELSSFQLISMKRSPHVSVVTNLSPNHLDVHKDMDEYADAKRNIVAFQKASDRAVLNYDNAFTRDYENSTNAKISFFSSKEKLKNGVFIDGETIFESNDRVTEEILKKSDIKLLGMHNVENYLAAISAVLGEVNNEAILKTARQFTGVKHRIELVTAIGGVNFYNDSIATTPSRSIAAISSFDKKVVLIAGGKGKGLEYDEFAKTIIYRTKAVFLIGAEAQKIRNAIESSLGVNDEVHIEIHNCLENAVRASVEVSEFGDIVLFSPACASFDMFSNFEERGDMFKRLVNELKTKVKV